MESRNLFQNRKLPPRRKTRPLWLVLTVSAFFPGAGHLFLRNVPLAVGLFLITLATAIASGVASFFDYGHLAWLMGRASMITALFSIADATLGVAEFADRREWRRTDRPRFTAYLNLVTYGVGSIRQGERPAGVACLLLGLAVHGWLASFNLAMLIMAELAVAAMAIYGHHAAHVHAWIRPVSVELGDIDAPAEAPPKPVDTTPGWVVPSLAIMFGLFFICALGSQVLQTVLVEALEVRHERELVMEPFYRNSDYGLSLEMNAPGWNFRDARGQDLVVAEHMSEDTQLRISIQPRFPFFSKDSAAALALVTEAAMHGYFLHVNRQSEAMVGGHPGYRIWAEGSCFGKPRQVMLLTTGKGWRQYVVWIEWGPGHDAFARTEAEFFEATFSLESGVPAGLPAAVEDGVESFAR